VCSPPAKPVRPETLIASTRCTLVSTSQSRESGESSRRRPPVLKPASPAGAPPVKPAIPGNPTSVFIVSSSYGRCLLIG
jgi:hypothetical protein